MLTQSQIDSFHKNGFLIMRGLFQGEELKLLREAADSVVEEGMAEQGTNHLYHTFADGQKVYRRSERLWERADIFKAVTVNPTLLENIGQCIGQAFYPWNDSLVVKAHEAGAPVPWHQDPPYGEPSRLSTYAVPNFTTDIYLDDSTLDNGAVYAIPEHHLVGHVELDRFTDEELFARPAAAPLLMNPGDVLFHALSAPHGSRASHGASMRRTFYIHYVAEDVYQDGYGHLSWAASKPGSGDFKDAQIADMLLSRKNFGWELPGKSLTLGEGGFMCVGDLHCPPRYWGTLAGLMSAEEISSKKRLDQ